ncbi:hypothetical protein [Streptomyces sp. SID13726]|uniref:hypothetical protein n=1 Tax=Streptomyces sp. SID13726 TaxID=2706058 RepID=UPI001EF2AF61|nr:hypothetical protein [Streptomyces sp. SID13726]
MPTARARLRVPPGIDAGAALKALTGDLTWAATDGPYAALGRAVRQVYGKPLAFLGQGGSIPLCNVLARTCPRAEIVLMGVEEPRCLIHAPNESVDPGEIEHMAHVEALFLQEYAASHRS